MLSLQCLEVLDTRRDRLEGSNSSAMVSVMIYLRLDGNKLSSRIPDSIARMQKLELLTAGKQGLA